MQRVLSIFITGVLLFSPSLAHAAAYPDVPADHDYATAIYDLQRRGIMQGNPDGTFGWEQALNRAELLTILFRATEKQARAIYSGCAPDVPPGAWFSDVICTAMHEKIVQGYPNGMFKPGQGVNRVEAIKMILSTLGFTVPELTQEDRLSLDFLGVTHGSWYAPYLHRALALDMIPPQMLKDNEFDPGAPVMREEAAEILYRAMNADDSIDNNTNDEDETNDTSSTHMELVDFPLHRVGRTQERGASAFRFDIEETGVVLVSATNLTSSSAGIECILFLLSDAGISSEFYVGYQEEGSCYIRTALRAGRYQIEVRSPSQGAEYSLDVEPSTGDGNDGFLEAISLSVGAARSGVLVENDYEDWYRFSVSSEKTHRAMLTAAEDLECGIFPGDDVDLFGFDSPKCNESFRYQPGTYYISIKRNPPSTLQRSYSVELR